MLRLPAIAAAVSLLVAAPAISQGSASHGRTAATAQLQTSNAELRLKVVDLEAENARLTGEIETLQFLLNQTRDQINNMQEDDKEIARQLKALTSKIGQLSAQVEKLESGQAVSSTTRYVTSSNPAPAGNASETEETSTETKIIRRTVSTSASGPHNISGNNTQRTVTTKIQPQTNASVSRARSVASSETAPRAISSGNNPAQTGSLGTISASNLPGAAGPLFAEAKTRLTRFDHAGAEEAFRAFLEQFGDDPQAGEAQYWLGETLYQQGAYGEAGAAYTQMIQSYPDDLRAPDALVKLARTMRLVGESERACAALAALPKRYPNAPSVTKNLAAVEATRASCE